jgi:hypothetical protein
MYPFFETPALLFFAVSYLSNYDLYLHHKPSGITYKAENIKPDSSQYNLPLLSDFDIAGKEGRLYKSHKAGELRAFFEEHKNIPVPKEIEGFLKSDPYHDAPVIVEYKLKN